MLRVWGGVLVMALLAVGCASTTAGLTDNGGDRGDVEAGDEDAGEAGEVLDGEDVGDDGGEAADGLDVSTGAHTVISLTAGGGAVSSTNYQLKISIGAPQPMGTGTSGTRDLRVGPGAVVNQ
jgi:hypothetical protein